MALRRTFSAASAAKNVVLVDGCRIPFVLANTSYKDYMAVDLARLALKGLLDKTALPAGDIDYILYGNVIQEPKTSNIAREASMGAGIPQHVPSHTVAQACISANAAICQGAEKILAGQADVVVAGGVETFSDVPIRFSKPLRQKLIRGQKVFKKGPGAAIPYLLKGLKPAHLVPDAPAIANYTTGEVMGHSSDRLAQRFGVSREDQDAFALRSHVNAAKAHAAGLYEEEIVAVDGSKEENGIKGDSSAEKLASLRPAFVKPHGTHTAANSSFLTDGASAALIMSEEKALAMGFKPKAYLRAWTFVAVDPFESMLLGPTYGANKVLTQLGLGLDDIDVVEFHEAFAGQVLSNFTAMGSDKFGQEELGRSGKVGDINMDKVNTRGGSLSLGHPFGATGARLATTAANRLRDEDGRFALLAACADSGLGHASIIERYPA
uniref:acetyl-CoA C-acyltransferase n=1 Tax=Phaeomonas parva TaxID=124430 RepID=A0A7S1TQ53_9STRA|mmetsp:Transcript_10802/g.32798  ORF Transcript_10802/g.32798 Transcript_10802/m.32798 type:complete len:437 (+) Transcript_10802:213-1523(+)|eukprot:CAMPEP_0118873428 /NCGR_PEP_ID=MMETSP1163-20130328/15223_1 /TAXON_ID=124430 /ORGANISM="Phaeomonas parva, Strain CCMP2877" /LENGTH=436 /DNA_ID=CAMNT_0006808699 /DNA_START=155 /DNA_END=1465 /DNA_ORIENTATION=+